MHMIQRIFRAGKGERFDAAATQLATGRRFSRRETAEASEAAKAQMVAERLASLLGQLTEQDRQLLLNAAQRLAGE